MKSKRSKATDIPMSVKKKVWERDNGRCVVCGMGGYVMPNAHILSRAKGGLGIETNIVSLCTDLNPNKCHSRFDNGTKEEHDKIYKIITKYMESIYPGWDIENQRYRKH